jgi:hypothetical protein
MNLSHLTSIKLKTDFCQTMFYAIVNVSTMSK